MKRSHLNAGLVLAILLSTVPWSYSQDRRPLRDEERVRLRAEKANVESIEEVGIQNLLSTQQIQELRSEGWSEGATLFTFAEFGITAREIRAIKQAGFDFVRARKLSGSQSPFLWPKPELLAYLSASADVIVIGQVQQVRLTKEGPYHTEALVRVDESLKHPLATDKVVVRLLYSGAYEGKNEESVKARANFEPQLKQGERVLLMLQQTPRMLQTLYAQARARGRFQDNNFVRNYGEPQKIQQALRDRSFYEVQSGYRIVGNNAVLKSEALYVSDTAHKLDLAEIKAIARKTWIAQERAGRSPTVPGAARSTR